MLKLLKNMRRKEALMALICAGLCGRADLL